MRQCNNIRDLFENVKDNIIWEQSEEYNKPISDK